MVTSIRKLVELPCDTDVFKNLFCREATKVHKRRRDGGGKTSNCEKSVEGRVTKLIRMDGSDQFLYVGRFP